MTTLRFIANEDFDPSKNKFPYDCIHNTLHEDDDIPAVIAQVRQFYPNHTWRVVECSNNEYIDLTQY